ncbi:hypothetical protein PIB30_054007 [Stylosanthes scabra]|uniref:Uncharacterized protein n=1 Tax=Stylosanthes scabra TaxID=79078 RepID=A0ABU6VGU7_9FABA|nr:hypothetical protein [Stylosanthes scabra]
MDEGEDGGDGLAAAAMEMGITLGFPPFQKKGRNDIVCGIYQKISWVPVRFNHPETDRFDDFQEVFNLVVPGCKSSRLCDWLTDEPVRPAGPNRFSELC